MKILILNNWFHGKNKIGLEKMLNYLGYEYEYGDNKKIKDYEVIYSPSQPIDVSKYPDKKFIFGPHFSVFPDNKLKKISNKNNSVYIQPSIWAAKQWIIKGADEYLPIKVLPFAVDIEKFKPIKEEREKIMLYYKTRDSKELDLLENFLKSKQIIYKIFSYKKRYQEEDYLRYLQECKYGIILGRHESQGFAIEEALSCNVPLLVWNAICMSQETISGYSKAESTTIPYWDSKCGEYFTKYDELEDKFNIFLEKVDKKEYNPRDFIINNLTEKHCGEVLKDIIESI